MKFNFVTLALSFLFSACSFVQAGPKVLIKTSHGDIKVDLNEEKAPESVKNFLSYMKEGFFDGTVFHRVMPDFMIQGGGFELKKDGVIEQKPTKAPIQNESKNGLKNERGTLAMARTPDPHSATAQFFINHKNNTNLDYPSFDGWGYAVFGKVIEGLEVVDKIAALPTTSKMLVARRGDATQEAEMDDVPEGNVVIESVKLITQ